MNTMTNIKDFCRSCGSNLECSKHVERDGLSFWLMSCINCVFAVWYIQ